MYPGEDGLFGSKYLNGTLENVDAEYTARNLSDTSTFKTEDEDNITNFCPGGTIKDNL